MNYKLFIDDERYPVTPDWFISRNSYDAQYAVTNYGVPTEIAFDHDLGGKDTSIIFIDWLFNFMYDNNLSLPIGFEYSVHSQNPIGAKNIKLKMDDLVNYFKEDENEKR